MYDPDKPLFTLEEYLAGLRLVESGSIEGDYAAVNPNSGAFGAYQLTPKYADYLITEAGQDPERIEEPAVQDEVAAYWARRHFTEFGNWDLCAVSWHAGQTNARLALIQDPPGCTPGPAVTLEMIEKAVEGETAYVERVREGALAWRGSRFLITVPGTYGLV